MAKGTGKALLVVDMLEDFVRVGAPFEVAAARTIVPLLKRRIAKARKGGELVVYVSDSHRKKDPEFSRTGCLPHAVEGTPGAAVVSPLAPEPGDVVVEKRSWSGFFRTNLDAVLKRNGVGSLSIAGCGTNVGILQTAADAAMRGYEVSVEEALAAGLDAKSHRFALGQMEKVLGVTVGR